MAIIARIVKIFKADLHGVMDQLEDQELLLKQHLRDMEEALHDKEEKLQKMKASRHQGRQELGRYKRQWESLEHDLKMAVRKDKDDIARMLIKKLKPLENASAELSSHLSELDEGITIFEDHLQQQRLKYEQLKSRSSAYLHKTHVYKKKKMAVDPESYGGHTYLSEQEIELELLKRKEMLSSDASG